LVVLALQLEQLGEMTVACKDILYASSHSVASPMKNVYLPQLSLLVELKLHIGHGLALYAST